MDTPENLRPEDAERRVLLIADDELVVCSVAQVALERAGYFVLTAHDGEEALTIARAFPGTIDLLVSDVNMPKIDGFRLREYMVAERPETAVLLMSGKVSEPIDIPFLPKPFTFPVLVDTVHRLLHKRAAGR